MKVRMYRLPALIMSAVLITGLLAGTSTAIQHDSLHITPQSAAITTGAVQANTIATIQPGEQLSGVIGVTEAELDGELETRTFKIRVRRASSNDSKAKIVANQVAHLQIRFEELEARKNRLDNAHDNGSISDGQYRAGIAKIAIETNTLHRQIDQSQQTAEDLPPETLEANGINETAIKRLKTAAADFSGPEVSEIARSIAGRDVNQGTVLERGPDNVDVPNETGPPSNEEPGAINASDDNTTGQGVVVNHDKEVEDEEERATDSDNGQQSTNKSAALSETVN